MSVARDEIAAQIKEVKKEWQQTVSQFDSAAEAPPGMSRADFKEWKHLKQQKAKFRLAELEERLKRLQLLESRLRIVRNLKVRSVQSEVVGFDLGQRHTAQAGAGSSSVQNTYEWERISTAEDVHDTDGGMSMLPGAIPDRVALIAGGQSEMSSRVGRDMYSRPPGLPPSEDELFDQTKELVRQMVRESLKNNLSAEDTFYSAQENSDAIKLRATAVLPLDPAPPTRDTASANPSIYDNEQSTPEEVVRGSYAHSGPIANNPMHTSGSSAVENYPAAMGEVSKESAAAAHESDNEKSRRPSSAKKVGFEGPEELNIPSPRKNRLLSQQSWIERVEGIPNVKYELELSSSVPATLEQATEISCPLFFGGFKRTSPVRRFCMETKNNLSFNVVVMLVTIANSVYIALAPDFEEVDPVRRKSAISQNLVAALFYFDIACAAVMGFEFLIGIIAHGFCMSETTYLRSSGFNQLDAACLLVTILEYLAIYLRLPNFTLRPFRMMRFFKPICRIEMFIGVKNIITTLKEGLPQLMIIFLFLILTLAAWCILCMALYQKSFQRRCVNRDYEVPVCASAGFGSTCNLITDSKKTVLVEGGGPAIAAGYPFERWCKVVGVEWDKDENGDWMLPLPFDGMYTPVARGYYDKGVNAYGVEKTFTYPKDKFGRYHTCQSDMWRRIDNFTTTQRCESVVNPMSGFSNFDNFWGSAMSLFQVIVPDSYYDVWWRCLQSEPWIIYPTRFLFIFINVFDTFLLLGLFVAVVTGTFKRVRERSGHDAFLSGAQGEELENDENYADMQEEDDEISGEETIRKIAIKMKRSFYFESLVSCAIGVQLVAIAVNGETEDKFWTDFGHYSTLACFSTFLFESLLNYLAIGDISRYWENMFHRFETILLLITFVGIVGNVKEFLVLPALRGYRLMKYFPTLQAMLHAAVSSVQAIFNVLVFITIVGLCFVVAGRYMFGSLMNDLSRANFGTFTLASLTMFQLFTGDSWSGIMYASVQTFPNSQVLRQFLGALLVLTWFIFASLIAKNLFVAVIIENFEISDTIENIRRPGRVDGVRQQFRKAYARMYRRRRAIDSGAVGLDVSSGMHHAGDDARNQVFRNKSARVLYHDFASLEKQIQKKTAEISAYAASNNKAPDSRIIRTVAAVTFAVPGRMFNEESADEPERVLFFLLPENPVRKFFVVLGRSAYFDTLILIAILASCFFLTIEPPFKDIVDSPEQLRSDDPFVPYPIMDFSNQIFTFFFLIEFCCRIMGHGLYFTKHAYLKEGWNVIDTIVLLFALVELSGLLQGMSLAKVFRMGRALKPLRLMKRNQSMRVVIDALLTTLQPIAYVILFLLFTLMVFGLIAIGVFGGKLFYCSNPNIGFPQGQIECVGHWIVPSGTASAVLFPAVWDNPYHFNFDSFGSSFLSLFMVSTFKYVAIMFACMDITEVGLSPMQNHATHWSIFFIIYILVGALFVMNLFVAFIIDGFNAAKGSTVAEETYRRFRRQLHSSRPKYDTFKPPQNMLSTQLRKLLESSLFQGFSTTCVLVNVFMLLADNADADASYEMVMTLQNDIFYAELCVEVALCSLAYGPLGFYNDFYRLFDLFVCLGSAVGYFFNNKAIGAFVKVFRLARVIRLAARFKAIKAILETLVGTAPQLTNIVLLLFLVYSMFAVLGVQLFALTRNGMRLGPTASFRDYQTAIFLIWQLITGDEWMILMKDLSVQPPFCTLVFTKEIEPGYQGVERTWGDCGSSSGAIIYCLALKLVCEYMMLNLFIGLILDNFSYITEDAGHKEDVLWTNGPSEAQLKEICDVFKRFDLGTGCVPIASLSAILQELALPIGYREANGNLYMKGSNLATCELLIRAELNLCLRHNRQLREEEAEKQRWFKKPEIKQIFKNYVDYDTLVSTIVFWRLPGIVPGIEQWQRHERIEECVLMAHALQCMEFFRTLVAARKQRKVNEMMSKRRAFIRFCEEDPHRKRRNIHASESKIKQKEIAKARKMPLLQLLNKPFQDTHELILKWISGSDIPEDIISHNKACLDYHMMRVPQPFTGLEVFKHRLPTCEVVLKVMDPNSNNANKDFLLVDMRKLEWRGWEANNTKHETYYSPMVFSGFDAHQKAIQPEAWDRIDLYIRLSSKKGARPKRLGSIEDLQSFVVEDTAQSPQKVGGRKNSRQSKAERSYSTLRINLGNHLYNSDKVKLQAMHFNSRGGIANVAKSLTKMKSMSKPGAPGSSHGKDTKGISTEQLVLTGPADISEGDTVLEVVGYIPIMSVPHHR